MVMAGATAAPYSTLSSIAYEIEAAIEEYINSKQLPQPRHTRLYATEINALERKANLAIDREVVSHIALYKLDEKAPLWSYGDHEETGDARVFEFNLIGSVYPDYHRDAEFHTDSLDLKRKQIGTLKIAIVSDIFQGWGGMKAFLLLSLLLYFAVQASLIGVWINKKSVLSPIDDIHSALDQLGRGDLTTPIPQNDWSEIGDIQLSIEQLRKQLLALAENEKAYLKTRLENENNLKRLSAANHYFIGSVANQTIPSLRVIKHALEQIDGKIISTDPIVNPLFKTVEVELELIADKINELVSAANASLVTIQLNYRPIDVSALLDTIVKNTGFLATKHNVRIEVTLDPKPPDSTNHFASDANKIRQIVATLLQCVIVRSDHGHIVINSRLHNERWFLKIIEVGGTLNEHELNRLFSTKRQVDRDAVGISASMLLIERLGGTLDVSST